MLPNWIIIGVSKAGTSSLFRWLADHPEVCGSKEKETYYFVDPGTHMYRRGRNFCDQGLACYEALFAHADAAARVLVEATSAYIYYETALRELPQLPTRPHSLCVLREPAAQIRSLHRLGPLAMAVEPRAKDKVLPFFVRKPERRQGRNGRT